MIGRSFSRRAVPCAATLAALALAPAAPAFAGSSAGRPRGHASELASARPPASATLEQCVTVGSQDERSATFAGQMSALAGTERMEMSVEVTERLPQEAAYHVVEAPGLGVWRSSAPGVQSYRYLRQVTNLAAPAFYRATIRFRWIGAHGRVLATSELHTRRCEEGPAVASGEPVT
jgi:hypothetical protein